MNGSGLLTVVLIAAGVFVVAAVWITVTRHPSTETPSAPNVVWMRPVDHRLAHAFYVAELCDELADVEPVAHCGRWPAAEMATDEGAARCMPCTRAVAAMA